MLQSIGRMHFHHLILALYTVLLVLVLYPLPADAEPPVLYQEAVARHDKAENAADAVSAQEWMDIAAALERFGEQYPDSPYAGEAALRRITIAMERLFDPEKADNAARQTGLLAKAPDDTDRGADPSRMFPQWYKSTASFSTAELKPVLYECYVRAAMVAHLRGEQGRAVELMRRSRRLEPPEYRRAGQRLTAIVRGWLEPLTPVYLLDGMENEVQIAGVRLADLALTTFYPAWAMEIYERLLIGADPLPEPSNRLRSYLFLRMKHALQFKGRREEAAAYRERRSESKYAKYQWAPDKLLSRGTRIWNSTQCAEVPMKLYMLCFTHYPEHPRSERALFFYAITAQRVEDYKAARWAFELYLERYPDSRWTTRVYYRELPRVIEMLEEAKK